MAAAIGGPVEAAALLAREFTAAAEASPAGVGSKG
jgi:hypothetical protein